MVKESRRSGNFCRVTEGERMKRLEQDDWPTDLVEWVEQEGDTVTSCYRIEELDYKAGCCYYVHAYKKNGTCGGQLIGESVGDQRRLPPEDDEKVSYLLDLLSMLCHIEEDMENIHAE
jgi:hypothetical protein